MKCECGSHWFSCDKVIYQDAIVSSISDAEYCGDVSLVNYEGPFVCTMCGKEYDSLGDE